MKLKANRPEHTKVDESPNSFNFRNRRKVYYVDHREALKVAAAATTA
jgi:hypothetical protein